MRAANRIFIKTLLAMGCNLPDFSSSSLGLATLLSWNGVGALFKVLLSTLANWQYASTQDSRKLFILYLTMFTGSSIHFPFLTFRFSMFVNLCSRASRLAADFFRWVPGFAFAAAACIASGLSTHLVLKIVFPVHHRFKSSSPLFFHSSLIGSEESSKMVVLLDSKTWMGTESSQSRGWKSFFLG